MAQPTNGKLEADFDEGILQDPQGKPVDSQGTPLDLWETLGDLSEILGAFLGPLGDPWVVPGVSGRSGRFFEISDFSESTGNAIVRRMH